jgi:hypothetical protein
MAMRAVLTGDIVNSTMLGKTAEKKLLHLMQQLFRDHKLEFYRGDSFQALLQQPAAALRLSLLCRAAAISLQESQPPAWSDFRISIGIGEVISPVRTLKTAKGQAFVLSGRALDEITKTNSRLAIITGNELANEGLQVIADYINSIFGAMTGKQAEAIFPLLKGETQQAVAHKLKKTKSTIHQRVISGRWPEIEKLLLQFEKIITQLI